MCCLHQIQAQTVLIRNKGGGGKTPWQCKIIYSVSILFITSFYMIAIYDLKLLSITFENISNSCPKNLQIKYKNYCHPVFSWFCHRFVRPKIKLMLERVHSRGGGGGGYDATEEWLQLGVSSSSSTTAGWLWMSKCFFLRQKKSSLSQTT